MRECVTCDDGTAGVCDRCSRPVCVDCAVIDDSGSYCEPCVALIAAKSLAAVGGRELHRAERRYDREALEYEQKGAS